MRCQYTNSNAVIAKRFLRYCVSVPKGIHSSVRNAEAVIWKGLYHRPI